MRIIKNSVYAAASALLLTSMSAFAAGEEQQQTAPSVVQPTENSAQNNALSTETYKFGDWEVNCVLQKMRDQNNNDTGQTRLNSCASKKSFKANSGEQTILFMGVSYGFNAEKGVDANPTIFYEAPLGIFLEPIYMRVDQNKAIAAPYRVCTQRSCSAGLAFDDSLYTTFKNGGELDIAFFVDPTKGPERYKVSLSGFTAATDFMKAAMAKAGQAVTKADLDALTK